MKKPPLGTVYTSESKAEDLAEILFYWADRLGIQIKQVIDPCCGQGALLKGVKAMRDVPISGYDLRPDVLPGNDLGCSAEPTNLFYCNEPFPEGTAVVVNPPYVGRAKLGRAIGADEVKRLKKVYPAKKAGSADLASYVARHILEKQRPILSAWLVTNTLFQGSSRRVGFQWALANGYHILEVTDSEEWGEGAAVHTRMCVLLDRTKIIGPLDIGYNSQGNYELERDNPQKLVSNAGLSFVGSIPLGRGFTLTPEEREQLIKKSRKNGELIFPYIGGKEVNTSPTQDFHRYVINFGTRTLEEAGAWPDLLNIVREKVKPERDKLRDTVDGLRLKATWWQFGRTRPALYEAIRYLPRCLVCCSVTPHLSFSFQDPSRVFSHRLIVFPVQYYAGFTILQSRAHVTWAWALSSTMQTDLSYSSTDCFENFPFPTEDPRDVIPALEAIGKRLYRARAKYMIQTNQGLTKLYNVLKDPEIVDCEEVKYLRQLHEEMDRQVLAAYGWDDIEVPEFTNTTEGFKNEVIDRLFELNKKRCAL